MEAFWFCSQFHRMSVKDRLAQLKSERETASVRLRSLSCFKGPGPETLTLDDIPEKEEEIDEEF